MSIEKEPDDQHKKKFKDVDILGSVKIQEFSGLHDRLSPHEEIFILTGIDIDRIPALGNEDGKKLLVVTNHRLLSYNSQDIKLLGEKKTFRDIHIDSIKEMDVEERKGFDKINITTKRGDESFMVPEGAGVKVTGQIRELQKHGDPLEELDRLSKHHEEGNITDDEYQSKKDEILDRV